MDTSEEYIKMVDIPEIQENRKYDGGDWFCMPEDGFSWALYQPVRGMTKEEADKYFDGLLWLPRQDQIQEMMDLTNPNDWHSSMPSDEGHVLWVLFRDSLGNYIDFDYAITGEQLWLGIYMWVEHSKTWDGTQWVDI